MEINTMNGYGYGYDTMNNPYFQQQPFQQQPMQVPQMQNALTNEEIQRLRSLRPTTSLWIRRKYCVQCARTKTTAEK